MKEKEYQHKIINRLCDIFPGCLVLKNDPTYIQGIPDLLILFKNKWAMLEVKCYSDSVIQPNQEYYIEMLNDLSFASFIFPDNEEDVLDALQSAFGVARQTRLFESQ